MTPEVQAAVEEIRHAFAGHRVEVEEEAQGGAYVIVHDLVVGDRYSPATSWFGFVIPRRFCNSGNGTPVSYSYLAIYFGT